MPLKASSSGSLSKARRYSVARPLQTAKKAISNALNKLKPKANPNQKKTYKKLKGPWKNSD